MGASLTAPATTVAGAPQRPQRSQTVLVVTPVLPPPLPREGNFQFGFHTPYVTKGSRFEVSKLDGIAQASCFASESGSIIGAFGSEPEKTGRAIDGHRFVLQPSTPLAPDRFYALLINSDEFLRVSDDFGPGPSRGVARFTFFNGSAPRIVAVRRDDAAQAPSLEVIFSEPLRVTDSLCVALLGARRNALDRACESERQQLVGSVRLQLKSGASNGALELRLPAEARGEYRSAAEGLTVLHQRREALALRLESSDFSSCGSEKCWREPPPPRLAREPETCAKPAVP